MASRQTSIRTCAPRRAGRAVLLVSVAGWIASAVEMEGGMRYISYRSASTGGISAARRAG
jgi:hypothetical protein